MILAQIVRSLVFTLSKSGDLLPLASSMYSVVDFDHHRQNTLRFATIELGRHQRALNGRFSSTDNPAPRNSRSAREPSRGVLCVGPDADVPALRRLVEFVIEGPGRKTVGIDNQTMAVDFKARLNPIRQLPMMRPIVAIQ